MSTLTITTGNFYLVKNKIIQLEMSTFSGKETDDDEREINDEKLDSVHKEVLEVFQKYFNKHKTFSKDKKSVYFVDFENLKWIEGKKSFKEINDKNFIFKKLDYTPATFVKADKDQKKNDAKALARPDKEEDYS